ncbi:hypothetical protein D9M69_678480 [compost metagenome]
MALQDQFRDIALGLRKLSLEDVNERIFGSRLGTYRAHVKIAVLEPAMQFQQRIDNRCQCFQRIHFPGQEGSIPEVPHHRINDGDSCLDGNDEANFFYQRAMLGRHAGMQILGD